MCPQLARTDPDCLFPLQVITQGSGVITTLTLSLVWIVYSIIPQYLLLHYTWIGRGTTLRYACQIGFYISSLCAFCAIILLWLVYPKTVRPHTPGCCSGVLDDSCLVLAWHRPFAHDCKVAVALTQLLQLGVFNGIFCLVTHYSNAVSGRTACRSGCSMLCHILC